MTVTATVAYVVWVLLAMGMILVWVLSYSAANGRHAVARPSAALARLATDPWLRAPLLVGWAWVGWHLFAR